MAEVVGAVATVSGVIQMAEYGYRLAKTLHSFAHEAGAAYNEIYGFAMHIETSVSAIELAESSLRRHYEQERSRGGKKSDVMAYIDSHRVMASLRRHSSFVRTQMREARATIKSMMDSKLRFMAAIKWTLRKSEILGLGPAIDSIKLTFQVVLSTVEFENLQRRLLSLKLSEREAERLRKELDMYKRAIKTHIKSIRQLQDKMQDDVKPEVQETVTLAASRLEALTELGTSIVRNETVPEIRPEGSPRPPSPPSPVSTEPPSSPGATGSTAPSSPAPSSRASSFPTTIEEEVGEGSRSAAAAELLPRIPRLDIASVKDLPFMNIYMRRTKGPSPALNVHARIAEGFPLNVISAPYARELELDIHPSDESGDGPLLDLGNGKPTKCIGYVVLPFWREVLDRSAPVAQQRRQQRQRAFSIRCEVCTYEERLLVLGEPFLAEKKRNVRQRER